ncbi:hypothetical protein C0J52_23837 [Blattella germanica]|nr:hypothetical protein C0J52_23837 [Blattella germanica]
MVCHLKGVTASGTEVKNHYFYCKSSRTRQGSTLGCKIMYLQIDGALGAIQVCYFPSEHGIISENETQKLPYAVQLNRTPRTESRYKVLEDLELIQLRSCWGHDKCCGTTDGSPGHPRPSTASLQISSIYHGTCMLPTGKHMMTPNEYSHSKHWMDVQVIRSHITKRAMRIICGAPPRSHCRSLFVYLGILTLPSVFVLCCLLYVDHKPQKTMLNEFNKRLSAVQARRLVGSLMNWTFPEQQSGEF